MLGVDDAGAAQPRGGTLIAFGVAGVHDAFRPALAMPDAPVWIVAPHCLDHAFQVGAVVTALVHGSHCLDQHVRVEVDVDLRVGADLLEIVQQVALHRVPICAGDAFGRLIVVKPVRLAEGDLGGAQRQGRIALRLGARGQPACQFSQRIGVGQIEARCGDLQRLGVVPTRIEQPRDGQYFGRHGETGVRLADRTHNLTEFDQPGHVEQQLAFGLRQAGSGDNKDSGLERRDARGGVPSFARCLWCPALSY